MPILDHGVLIDREELVVLGIVVVDDPDKVASDRAVGSLILDRNPVDHVLVGDVVVRYKRRGVGAGQFTEGLLQGIRRHLPIQTFQRLAETTFKHDLPIVLSLTSHLPRRYVEP
jgi:hypothetical protein